MNEINLTDEDLAIVYGRSALAAFMGSLAQAMQQLTECPNDVAPQDFLLKALQENLRRVSSPNARYPMDEKERALLAQHYRVFLAFYRDPNALVNLPADSTSPH